MLPVKIFIIYLLTSSVFYSQNLIELIYIEGGDFLIGALETDSLALEFEKPSHKVKVNSFFVSKTEITQKHWRVISGNNPSYFKGDNLPIETVNWLDALEFCNRLSEIEGLEKCYDIKGWDSTKWNQNANGYRLPTEAEWEYLLKYEKESIEIINYENLRDYAWYQINSNYKTQEVGLLKPNQLGIYDLIGNVSEWVYDAFDEDYYKEKDYDNPIGPVFQGKRIFKGGSWINTEMNLRISNKFYDWASSQLPFLGFRVVRNVY